jgi:dihydropteroate synthase
MTPSPAAPARTLAACDRHLPLGDRPLLMGILNVTPDSFSDGGRFAGQEAAFTHGLKLVADGADILDIGGESTRPGSSIVSAEEELARVLPPLKALAEAVPVPISIDTYKASVAARAVEAGARIVNDVWGLQRDPEMAATVAACGAAVILMHNREKADPAIDIMAEVRDFLSRSIDRALAAGIAEDRIVVDPGIGFGKTPAQSMLLIARLAELRTLGYPVLLGASRKSFIGRVLDVEPDHRLSGTLAAHVIGAMNGADIIRAHDVAEHHDALRVLQAIRGQAE